MLHHIFGKKNNINIAKVLTTKLMLDKVHSCDKNIFRNMNAEVLVHNHFKDPL